MELPAYMTETHEEERLRLHKERIARAKAWRETGEKINLVKIEEKDLEEHFEANWDRYNENFHNKNLEWWKAYRDRRELTVVESKNGERTFVVDEDNLVIVKPEDIIYFYRVGPCWPVLIDLETKDQGTLRVAYHQGGVLSAFKKSLRDVDMGYLVDLLQEEGKVQQISIFYNGSIQQEEDIEATRKVLPPEIPVSLHDMGKKFGGAGKDLFVKGNRTEVYENKDSKRVYSGELPVFEAKV